jgi:ATP-dependent exoDNAse (exonuclease V) beta subunit
VEACLARLEALPLARQPGDPQGFAALLERLFAAPDPAADARLQVMSIHKAKGLEFDTVILPGLGRVPRHDDPPLLRWFERPLPAPGGAGLLLAPIHEAGPQRDAVYDYLAALEREKARHETGRLLYVAATRARRALHLFGHAALKDGAPVAPDGRSLLARLWPALQADFEAAAEDVQAEVDAEVHAEAPQAGAGTPVPLEPPGAPQPSTVLRRLVAGWAPPAPPPAVALPAVGDEGEPPPQAYDVEFRWAGETARHVGTVVHRLLRLIARHGPERWQAALSQTERGAFSRPAIAAALAALGIPAAERDEALGRVLEALQRTLADERGRWVLAPHRDGHSEYALTGLVGGRAAHFVIDRTFVDDAGVRWIVDFKTGAHAGGELEAFLEREQQRYRAQLEGYAALLARLEPQRPIRLALYFPLLQAWREWPAPDTASPPGALPSPDA